MLFFSASKAFLICSFIATSYADVQSSAQQVLAPNAQLGWNSIVHNAFKQDLNETIRLLEAKVSQEEPETDHVETQVHEVNPYDQYDYAFPVEDNRIEIYEQHLVGEDINQPYMTSFGKTHFLLSDEPILPEDVDPEGWHMFVRLDTVPKTYPSIGPINHAGINKLMFDLGGQHVDIVFGSPSRGWYDCGLSLKDKAWPATHPNGDGYPVIADCGKLKPYDRDAYNYIGRYGGGNVPRLAHEILHGKTYDHKIHHCGTFVEIILQRMGFR